MRQSELIREYGYPSVWITDSHGDHPNDLRQAIIAESLTDLQAIAKLHSGTVVMLKKQGGRHYYQSKGRFCCDSLVDIQPSDDKTKVVTIWDDAEDNVNKYLLKGFDSWGNYITERADTSDLDDLLDHLKRVVVTQKNMLACVDFDFITAIIMDDSSDVVAFSVNEEDVSYYYDGIEYKLAVELP